MNEAGPEVPPSPAEPAPPAGPPPPSPFEPGEIEPRPRPLPPLSRLVLGLVLLGGGVVWLLAATNVIDFSPLLVLAAALIVVGLALVAGSRTGRHSGLTLIGIVLTIVLAAASTFDIRLSGGVGDRREQPAILADLHRTYELGVGQLTIDLRGLSFPEGTTTRIDAHVGIGQLTVEIPDNVAVQAHGRSGLGQVSLFGRESSGFDAEVRLSREPNAGAPSGVARLVLELSVGLGQVTLDGSA